MTKEELLQQRIGQLVSQYEGALADVNTRFTEIIEEKDKRIKELNEKLEKANSHTTTPEATKTN